MIKRILVVSQPSEGEVLEEVSLLRTPMSGKSLRMPRNSFLIETHGSAWRVSGGSRHWQNNSP